MGRPWPLYRLFSLFSSIEIVQTNVKNFPTSIHCRDSNSRPIDHQSPHVTAAQLIFSSKY